jgi:hypothetical protein
MSHLRFSRSLSALLALPLFAACGYGDHGRMHDDRNYPTTPAPSPQIEEATIDADQLLDVEPGLGAGAYIEYESGGTYYVTTSCDAEQSGVCYWDIIVTPLGDATVGSVTPLDLEEEDSVTVGASNQIRLVARTSTDFDGFSFRTDPGAAVEVDVLLDNGAGNRYLFWVGDGALRSGAPSNPVDLVPSAE